MFQIADKMFSACGFVKMDESKCGIVSYARKNATYGYMQIIDIYRRYDGSYNAHSYIKNSNSTKFSGIRLTELESLLCTKKSLELSLKYKRSEYKWDRVVNILLILPIHLLNDKMKRRSKND